MDSERSDGLLNPARRRALAGVGALALAPWCAAAAAEITDGAGRRVTRSGPVRLVFPAGGPAAILLYTLAPDLLAGWPRANRAPELAYLLPGVGDRPEVGRLTGRGGTANLETVLALKPDLIIDSGSTRGTYVDLAERVQRQTGIPYALFDGRLEAIPDTYRALGRLIGREERAEQLAAWAERTMATVREGLVDVREQPRVYYARGPRGLETGLAGSINVEILDFMGLTHFGMRMPGGLANVPLEEVLWWDPQVIITIDRDFAATARRDPIWAGVSAVRNGRVHLSPKLPFGWVDFPPSVNRLPGLFWLGQKVHPERFPEDLAALTREFYALFYQVEPSDAQIADVLEGRG
ncbi:MAG: iron ABC transporter substrate-binding protein [Azoarcus sp.]|nr:iron ABC transporter substrate-binding protein [Azoarcus sp.]